MILLFAVWILTAILVLPYGYITSKLLHYLAKDRKNDTSIVEVFFLGIVSISTSLSITNFFHSINLIVFSGICLIAILIYLYCGKEFLEFLKSHIKNFLFDLTFSKLVLLFILLIPIVIYSLSSPYLYDLDLYHIQYMRWISEYKIIPGLGNLHGRLAFNSSFLMLSSIFMNFKAFYIFPFNGLFNIFVIFELFRKFGQRNNTTNAVYILIFVIYIHFFGSSLSSTSTDYGANIMVLYLLMYTSDRYSEIGKYNILCISTIALFCITLKLSCIMIILLPLFLFIKFRKDVFNIRFITLTLLIVSFVIIPWGLRFIILSGYLIYPFDKIDIFSFDWKIPIQNVINEKEAAYWWARNYQLDRKEVLAMKFTEWFPLWFKNLHLFSKSIFTLSFISPLVLLIIYFFKKKTHPFLYIATCVGFIGTVYLICTAPDIRFSSSFVFVTCFVPYIGIIQINHYIRKASLIIIFSFLLFLSFNTTHTAIGLLRTNQTITDKHLSEVIFHPQEYGQRTKNMNFKIFDIDDNHLIYKPIGTDRCYDHYLPCTPYPNPNLHFRGDKIEDGFIIKEKK